MDPKSIKTEKKLVEGYMQQHKMETIINEVVNVCLRERPQDPFLQMGKLMYEKSTSTKGILSCRAYQVLDSTATPTVEVIIGTDKGRFSAQSSLPIAKNALELDRLVDNKPDIYNGKSVQVAIDAFEKSFRDILMNKDPVVQTTVDEELTEKDGTLTKSKLGANTIYATSMAVCKAGAGTKQVELYKHLGELANRNEFALPVPCVTVYESKRKRIFEHISVLPIGADSFQQALQMSVDIYHKILPGIDDERDLEDACMFVWEGVKALGYDSKVKLGLMINARRLIPAAEDESSSQTEEVEGDEKRDDETGEEKNPANEDDEESKGGEGTGEITYFVDGDTDTEGISGSDLVSRYRELLIEKMPDTIISIIEPFDQNDSVNCQQFTEEFDETVAIWSCDCRNDVQDVEKGEEFSSNGVVFRSTDVSTVTELVQNIQFAHADEMSVCLSTVGDTATTDDALAHAAVGLGAGMIALGSPASSSFAPHANRLIQLEIELDSEAFYAGDRFRAPF